MLKWFIGCDFSNHLDLFKLGSILLNRFLIDEVAITVWSFGTNAIDVTIFAKTLNRTWGARNTKRSKQR